MGGVLHVWRKIDAKALGCSVESHLLLAPTHRFVASSTEGCCYLSSLLPPQPAPGRVHLYLVLAGEVEVVGELAARSRTDSAARRLDCGPGTLFLSSTRDDFYQRACARPSSSHRALTLQLDADRVTPRCSWPHATPASVELFAAGHELYGAMQDPEVTPSRLYEVARLVVAQLAPYVEIAELAWGEHEATATADALRRVFSVVGTIPTLSDMAAQTGLSERTVRRLVRAATQEVGLPFSGWRTWRESWTVSVAALLLTANDGTPARVAETVGYGDVPALYHAFKRAGLPPPSEVRERALQALK